MRNDTVEQKSSNVVYVTVPNLQSLARSPITKIGKGSHNFKNGHVTKLLFWEFIICRILIEIVNLCTKPEVSSFTCSKFNKKDGYRQQNVRQRQKLISIIDYDVCILEYLQPFWRFSMSKNGLTLKSGYGVLQGH